MRAATMAGTANTRRNIGASSATEYPALATPMYMLMPAPTSHTGMNHRAAVTIPVTGAPALKSRPASTKIPNRTRPPAITLIVCEMAASRGRSVRTASAFEGLLDDGEPLLHHRGDIRSDLVR
jgi:hypothetical protein